MSNLLNYKILNYGSIVMQFLGETPSPASVKLRALRILNLSIVLFLTYFVLLNFFYVTGEGYIQALESLTTISHLLLKYSLLVFYKDNIRKLVKNTNDKFWNHKGFSTRTQISWKKAFKTVNNIQVTVLAVSYITSYTYLLRAIFDRKYSFILDTFIPKGIATDAFILFCQYYFFCFCLVVVLSYDLTYLFLCVQIVLQLRLLKENVNNIIQNADSEMMKEINKCISYHQFLLTMFTKMQKIFSVMFFFHYFVTVITTCSDLFILTWYANATVIGVKFTSLVFLFAQFAYYTFPANEVACQFSDIARTVYMSKWYQANTEVQKSLLFMMVKCQRMHYFSGAGLMDINIDAFGSVVRKTFSFYAIMRNLISK